MAVVLENVVQIAAPPGVVWGVTVDVERWPEWNANFKKIERLDEGPFSQGSVALIQQVGLPKAKWVVTSLIPGERFSWESRVLGMRMIGTHELSPTETGTQNLLRIEISGIMASLLSPILRQAAGRALAQENAGLKAKCEGLASSDAAVRQSGQ